MPDYTYLIIGGSMTAHAAIEGIRQIDTAGSIGVIQGEAHKPYSRPPLSKALWKGTPVESIWLKTPGDGITFHLSTVATGLDPSKKIVTDDNGNRYSYGKLLLATGGTVRKFPAVPDGVIYYRTLDDFTKLKRMAEERRSFAVVGGGFIGSEIAAALSMNNKSVTMVVAEDSIGARIFPKELSEFVTTYYQSKGVTTILHDGVIGIEHLGDGYQLKTAKGNSFIVDCVVAGIGIQPATKLAEDAGLKVDNGIVVDAFLRTTDRSIYAAGDVARYHNPHLDGFTRSEHEDNALKMGEAAGRNMAGADSKYDHIPFFYSDLFDLGYEAVGELDSRHEIVEDWKDKFHEGVIYYLKDKRVRGILLWNTWDQVENARAILRQKTDVKAKDLIGRLPA